MPEIMHNFSFEAVLQDRRVNCIVAGVLATESRIKGTIQGNGS